MGKKVLVVDDEKLIVKGIRFRDNWRTVTPKKISGSDNEALVAAVCPHVDHVPVK